MKTIKSTIVLSLLLSSVCLINCQKDSINSSVNLTEVEIKILNDLCIDKDKLIQELSDNEKQKNRKIPVKIEDFTDKEAVIFDRKGSNPDYAGNYYIIIDKKRYSSCKLPKEFWQSNLKIVLSATSFTWYCNDCDTESLPIVISKIKAL